MTAPDRPMSEQMALEQRIKNAIDRETLNLPLKASTVTIHVLEDCLAAIRPTEAQAWAEVLTLQAVLRAWEALLEGHFSPKVVEAWLWHDMKPAMAAVRRALSAPAKEDSTPSRPGTPGRPRSRRREVNPLHDEIALKECPFCGAEAGFAEGADNDGPWVAVACTECGCGGGKHYPIMDDAHPNAASEWNHRTRLPEIAALREGEWRDIVSAPKDGTLILLWRPSSWAEEAPLIARWASSDLFPEGFWQVHDGKNDHDLRGPDPTHWMPAPPSPANSEVRS